MTFKIEIESGVRTVYLRVSMIYGGNGCGSGTWLRQELASSCKAMSLILLKVIFCAMNE
jgi:hypothetical protein